MLVFRLFDKIMNTECTYNDEKTKVTRKDEGRSAIYKLSGIPWSASEVQKYARERHGVEISTSDLESYRNRESAERERAAARQHQLTEPKKQPAKEYKEGDRVVIKKASRTGLDDRHGTISKVSKYVMQDIFGGNQKTTVYYEVKTDNGYKMIATSGEALEPETEKPAREPVKDILVDNYWHLPEEAFTSISHYRRRAKQYRDKAKRARKASQVTAWQDQARREEQTAKNFEEAYNAWAKEYPEEAAKIKKEMAPEPRAPETPPAVSAGITAATGNDTEKLKSIGINLLKTRTKNGNAVWNATGNTKEYKEGIKAAGGRWYGPAKVWSFDEAVAKIGNWLDTL